MIRQIRLEVNGKVVDAMQLAKAKQDLRNFYNATPSSLKIVRSDRGETAVSA